MKLGTRNPFFALAATSALLGSLLFGAQSTSAQSFESQPIIELPHLPSSDGAELRSEGIPENGSVAACTPGQALVQDVVSHTSTGTAGGLELGQSFTAPCDGMLTHIVFAHQAAAAASTITGNLIVYNGAGTGGTVLTSLPFFVPAVPATFFERRSLALNTPITVVMGQVYTFFLDLSSGATAFHVRTPSIYAGGALYFTANGNPASAGPDNTFDMRFQAIFHPPSVGPISTPVFDGPGWRMLAPPVYGIQAHDLAMMNLVQGIPGSVSTPEQYPAAAPNLFFTYNGDGTYSPPANTATHAGQGLGFFWYWYDNDGGPWPGGTSVSHELSSFLLASSGPPFTTNGVLTRTQRADEFYMIGNAYRYPLSATGITVSNATMSTVFNTWSPAANGGTGGYVNIFKSNPGNGGMPDYIAPWQGFFSEMTTNPGVNPTFNFAVASTDPGQTPPFYGRHGNAATPYVHFALSGETDSGAMVGDEAVYVRVLDDALEGWDQHDSSKLPSFTFPNAALAPVIERDAAPYRLSVNSLPPSTDTAIVSVIDFQTTEGGQFEIRWDGPSDLPENWEAYLIDSAAGVTVDLRLEEEYAFASGATDGTERFTLELYPASVVTNEPGAGLPDSFALHSAYPNPFNPATTVRFDVPQAGAVTIDVLDVLGRRVAVLADEAFEAGSHAIQWDAQGLASGTYLIRMNAAQFSQAQRITLLK